MRLSCLLQQGDEFFQGLAAEMPKLSAAAAPHVDRELVDERNPGGGDRHADDTSVLIAAPTLHESLCLEPVQQSGHVWGARNQPSPECRCRQSLRPDGAKHPQCVVLLRSYVSRMKNRLIDLTEPIVRSP